MPNYGINQTTPYGSYLTKRAQEQRGDIWKKMVLPAAGFATAGIGSLLFGGGAGTAASVPGAVGASSAPLGGGTVAAKSGFSIGKLLGSKGAELVAGLGTTLLGNRSAGKAQKEANALTERTNAAQMALAREQYERENQNYAADRADAEKRWMAEEAFRAKQFAAEEEERLEQRRLRDEREARLAPRRAMSQQALLRVGQILGWH